MLKCYSESFVLCHYHSFAVSEHRNFSFNECLLNRSSECSHSFVLQEHRSFVASEHRNFAFNKFPLNHLSEYHISVKLFVESIDLYSVAIHLLVHIVWLMFEIVTLPLFSIFLIKQMQDNCFHISILFSLIHLCRKIKLSKTHERDE